MRKTHGPYPTPVRLKSVLVTGYVLHVIEDGTMVDTVFDTAVKRDVAAVRYVKKTGKLCWKTIVQRKIR